MWAAREKRLELRLVRRLEEAASSAWARSGWSAPSAATRSEGPTTASTLTSVRPRAPRLSRISCDVECSHAFTGVEAVECILLAVFVPKCL